MTSCFWDALAGYTPTGKQGPARSVAGGCIVMKWVTILQCEIFIKPLRIRSAVSRKIIPHCEINL